MKVFAAIILVLGSFCGYAAAPLSVTVDSSLPQFVITLPANPTTGYQWAVTSYDKKKLQMVGSRYLAPSTRLIGAGGNMTFTFAAVKGKSYPKSTKIFFKYTRPWEHTGGTVQKVTVTFK